MATQSFEVGRAVAFDNSANVTLTRGTRILGIFCSSSTSGTVKLSDADKTLVDTFTMAAATWYRIPIVCHKDTTVTVGGTFKGTLVLCEG